MLQIEEFVHEIKEVKEQLEEVNKLVEELKEVNGLAEELNEVNGLAEELNEVSELEKEQKKIYQKFSKWLRDHKDNQIVVVIFTLLAGVDIAHLELLGSKLRLNYSFK